MQIDSDDLLAQIKRDWPVETELSTLRLINQRLYEQVAQLEAEADRRNPSVTATYPAPDPGLTRTFTNSYATQDGDRA